MNPREVLSGRELEVLRLAAHGHDNAAIAGELTVSVRTVDRHFQNIYDRLGLRGRSARAGAVPACSPPGDGIQGVRRAGVSRR